MFRMISLQFGFYPFIGIMVACLLYGLYYRVLRMKCTPRKGQLAIFSAIIIAMLFTWGTIVRVNPLVEAIDPQTGNPFALTRQGADITPREDAVAKMSSDVDNVVMHDIETASVSSVESVHHAVQSNRVPTWSQRVAKALHLLVQDVYPVFGWVYLFGVVCVLIHFFIQLIWLCTMRKNNRSERVGEYHGANIYETTFKSPFSFGHCIFLPQILDDEVRQYVLMHESIHINHRHFLKLCLLECLLALNWFNPFVWLFFREMKLQQEFEVDAEVVASGQDRERYQICLLKLCIQSGNWILIQSNFGIKPLRQRIVFMNEPSDWRLAKRHWQLGIAVACLLVCVMVIAGCETHSQYETSPLAGCWRMDWIRNTNDQMEHVPPFVQYQFQNNNTCFHFSYGSRSGRNIYFNMSAEDYSLRNDTLFNAKGEQVDYKFVDKNTYQIRWIKDSLQTTLVAGPDITEQWTRSKPDASVVELFGLMLSEDDSKTRTSVRQAASASGIHRAELDGVWMAPTDTKNVEKYLIVHGDFFTYFTYYHRNTDYFSRGAGGMCGDLKWVEGDSIQLLDRCFHVQFDDTEHLTLSRVNHIQYVVKMSQLPDMDDVPIGKDALAPNEKDTYFVMKDSVVNETIRMHRAPLPAGFTRMLSPALVK